MSKDQIKLEISKVLDTFSESALQKLYSFLQQLAKNDSTAFLNASSLQKILSEDKELLERLAR